MLEETNLESNLPPSASLVLAAGAATRMGRPKQLLPYGDETLLTHAVRENLAAGFDPVVVVLGANAELIAPTLGALPVEITVNDGWEQGMGSSIRAGLEQLSDRLSQLQALAITLADQPLVIASHLRALRRLQMRRGVDAVAAEYNGQPGVPALFGVALFDRLSMLSPESGARAILRDPRISMLRYPIPEAATDIDTPGDFAAILRQEAKADGNR